MDFRLFFPLLFLCGCLLGSAAGVSAGEKSVFEKLPGEWGGHVRLRGILSRPEGDSLLGSSRSKTYEDGQFDFRIKNRLYFGDRAVFGAHYELLATAGETRRRVSELARLAPDLFGQGGLAVLPVEDDRRVMDLTKAIDEKEGRLLYHRLDRLYLALLPRWGTVTLGRQAVTWGNGLVFNPMDLFNPFSPTDIERDYKIGDDMLSIEFSGARAGACQVLLVPRRDPLDGNLTWDQSSLAGKAHGALGTLEYDLMLGRHYEDTVLGLGWTGYLGDAAWRLDSVYTVLGEDGEDEGFLALVANLDYSWVWGGRNFYGFLEFYFNGLGHRDYTRALTDPNLLLRLARGELHTLGRYYLSGHLRVELHPLFNVYFSVINNLADPSGVLQPRAVWDMTQDLRLTLGGNLYYGATGTEYGGFRIPAMSALNRAPQDAFLWLTLFF